ncbi:sterile alpha motif domain-containing protein 11-like [Branchiostoma lanceolatum]|uniref:sterile alpha motif domain-containing protein 11-like n=1 Tax=Branchiostoma lanceolatum TaxID=7740 RepID=UPI003455566F
MSEAALNLSKAEAKKSRREEEKEARKMRSKEQAKDDTDASTKPASEPRPGKENAASEPKPGKENSAFEANSSSAKTLPGGSSEYLKDVSSGVKSEKTDGFHHTPEYHEPPPGPAMHLHPLHPTAIPGLPSYGHLGYGLFPGLHPAPRPEEALAGCEDVEILYDSGEPVIEVECGENKAFLYINKLCQGSKGPSIRLNSEMLTPNEFQFISGRETAKDWKRSIRHKGKSLKTLMAKGILQVHPPICDCPGCRISSPVAAMLQNRGRLVEKRGGPSSGRRREENQSDDGENGGEADEEQGPSSGKKSNLSSIISHLYCSASSASGGSGTAGDRAAASSPNDSSSGETSGLEGLGLRGVQGTGRKRGRGRAEERREAAGQTKRRRSASPPRDDSPPTNGDDTSAAAYLSSDYRQRLLSALNNEQGTYEEQQQRIYQLANSMEPDRGAQQENPGPKENGVCSRRSTPGSPTAGDGPDRAHSPTAARHSPHKPPLPPHMEPGALPREYLETGGHFFNPHTPHIALGAHLRPPFLGFPHLLSPAHLGYTFLRPGETTPQELLARQNDLLRKRYADQMNTEILLRQQEAFRRYASLSREQQRRLAGEPLSAVPGVMPPDPHLMHPAYAADSPLLYPSEQARRNAMLVLRHAPEVSLPHELSPTHSRERSSPPAKPQETPTHVRIHTESESSEREKVPKEDGETEELEVNGDVAQDDVPRRPESPSESKDSESESQPERPSSRDSNASSNNNDCTCRGVACCRDNNIREPEETIASWTVDDVYQFIKSLSGCSEYAQTFKDQAIDGETLPMLHEELLQNQLGMKLGPALKIRAQVAKRQGRCSICFHCLHCHKGQNSVTSEDPPQSPSPAASCS